MINKIEKKELIMFQMLSHPIASGEILFHDFDGLGLWDKSKFGNIRPCQYPMLSYDSLFLYDNKKTAEENNKIENDLAESYNLGGRLTGKSIIFITLDSILATFKQIYKWTVISSYDNLHIKSIIEKLINCFDNHKILKHLNCHSIRSPFRLDFVNGCLLEGVNQNITGKNPGGQFYQKHFDRHYMEESAFLTKEVSGKMLMAQAEKGCKNRFSGMTTFTKASPMGEIFFDLRNKKKLINLPSYVNPTWNDKKEDDAIREFGGKDSPGYKVQIEGKVFEGLESVFDILRIRETYIRDKQGDGIEVKKFEVNKETFHRFKDFLIIERPFNAESLGFYFDVGEGGAPSEYIVIVKTNKKYKYIYRITTYKLSPNEEEEFVDYLIEVLKPNVVGLDHTSGLGKSMFSHLINKYPDNTNTFVAVDFNSNLEIGFKKDKDGKFVRDKEGKLIFEKANVVDWSIQCLKDIFYNDKIECYEDIKFDTQINNIVAAKNKNGKLIYDCKGENHLFQAWQVFAISYWNTEFQNIQPINSNRKPGMGSFGTK